MFGQYNGYVGQVGLDQAQGGNDNNASVSNPNLPSGQVMPDYGGYKGGFGDTMRYEGQLAHSAQNQAAPTANFGQANKFQNYQNSIGHSQGVLAGRDVAQGHQLAALASGHGLGASDYAFRQSLGSNVAGAQGAAAAGGNPLAARNAMAGMGAANLGAVSGYGGAKSAEMQAAQAGATNAYGQGAGAYGEQGTQGLYAAQQAAQQAQFDPTLQASQNKVNDMSALGYTNAGLGVQANQQAMDLSAQAAFNNYYYGMGNLDIQQQNAITGAITGAAGAGAATVVGAA